MNKTMKTLCAAVVLSVMSSAALAKLPAPSDEAKAKAAEAAAKAAWAGKVDAYRSCMAQDKVAAHYFQSAKVAAKDVKPPAALPPCADPGAFSYAPTALAKPLEASGAHSPPATATSPPSGKAPAAAIAPAKKP
ncbi:MAG: hypothetical protein PHQ58_07870 [Rhodoferax sp.]|uniref:hypothetical protein n=1 Tax=Rhodoferax sp. TaxID=50421 RepID=UPI0026247A03|nr:hypothetical protein [Rhodoferax sp.]MDD2880340.1 hypothetical protein [Rhodoferax sp.]